MSPKRRKKEHPFDGIVAKLTRASQNILKLNSQINAFHKRGKYATVPHPDDKVSFQDALEYHQRRFIPKRFAVMAGEIIHHLRSCLDHVAWHFSDLPYRADHPNSIEFPVFQKKPSGGELARYKGKIKGISNPSVIDLIAQLQPYHAGNHAKSNPLCIVHDMDRFDKHRELALMFSTVNVNFATPEIANFVREQMSLEKQGKLSLREKAAIGHTMKKHGKATPQISFRQFGEIQAQPVIPGLLYLLGEIDVAIAKFLDYA